VSRAGRTTTIPLPTPFSIGRVNCYLLHGSPLTLIDPGPRSGETRETLVAALAEEGLALADVELVLLTHQHTDHAGLAASVAAESGASVAAHRDLVGYLGDMTVSLAAEDDYQARMMLLHGVAPETVETLRAVSKGFHHFAAAVAVDAPLAHGDVIEAGDRLLRVLFRPGHSPSDIVLVDDERGTAFVGDHLLAQISSNPIAHGPLVGEADPRRRPPTLPTFLASLALTAELDLRSALTGHGEPVDDVRGLVAERVARQEARTARVLAALADGPQGAHGIAREMWGDVATTQAYLTLSEVLGALDVLLEQGAVVELETDGGEGLAYAAA
jgi:glyoxylase-like metal-dependent hydrolase (beta-lactamase superfamily II)